MTEVSPTSSKATEVARPNASRATEVARPNASRATEVARPEPSDGGATHFIQQCDGPVFVGPGGGTLDCPCGHTLIQGYDPARWLAIGVRCGRCGQLTTTAGLPVGAAPPFAAIVAEPVAEPRPVSTPMPDHAFVIGRAEMDRIIRLYQPVTPARHSYCLTPALLDSVIAGYDRYAAAPLAAGAADADERFPGLANHPLAWAVGHLRGRMQGAAWACLDDVATSIATVHVTGFLHFVATWSHHPLFPAMMAGVAAQGGSVHRLSLFAAAHCMALQGNRISFPAPSARASGTPAGIDGFNLATGPTDTVAVYLDILDRFEVPFGQPWNQASLRAAVADRIAAAQSRINLRNPGLLVLSPGSALAGFDEALIEAVQHALHAAGRRNRGLMAVAPTVLRLQALPDPHAVRFGYGFFPTPNRHYGGDSLLQAGGPPGSSAAGQSLVGPG